MFIQVYMVLPQEKDIYVNTHHITAIEQGKPESPTQPRTILHFDDNTKIVCANKAKDIVNLLNKRSQT